MTMKIVPFIFNWENQFEKTKRSEQQLKKTFSRVFVINSDPENTRDDWVNVGSDAYFTTQFFKAIDLFDGDILFHLQADASYDRWQEVFDSALSAFYKYNWGVFAPNVDFTGWDSTRVNIGSEYIAEPELSLVSCTDCTCWLIHKDIIRQFIRRKSQFVDNTYGWGIDITMSALSYLNQRPVIRDYGHTIVHPRGRGYDNQAATAEFKAFLNGLDEELKPVVGVLRNNRQNLLKYLCPSQGVEKE